MDMLSSSSGGNTVNLASESKKLFKDYSNCYNNHQRGVRWKFQETTKSQRQLQRHLQQDFSSKEIITTVTVLCLTEQDGCRREEILLGGMGTMRGEEDRKQHCNNLKQGSNLPHLKQIQELGHFENCGYANNSYLGKAELVIFEANSQLGYGVLSQLRIQSLEAEMPEILWELCSSLMRPKVTQEKYPKTITQSQVILDKSHNKVEESPLGKILFCFHFNFAPVRSTITFLSHPPALLHLQRIFLICLVETCM